MKRKNPGKPEFPLAVTLSLSKMVHTMKIMTFTQEIYCAVFIVQCIHLKYSRVLICN